MGAIQFIENMDRTVLNIPDEDFEREVEAAVSAMAERDLTKPGPAGQKDAADRYDGFPHAESDWTRSPKTSLPTEGLDSSASDVTIQMTDEDTANKGLLDTIQRPLSSISRIFSESNGPPSGRSTILAPSQQATGTMASGQTSTAWLHREKVASDLEDGCAQVYSPAQPAFSGQARQDQAEATLKASSVRRPEYQDVIE